MRGVIQDDREARFMFERACGVTICEPYSGLVFFDGVRPIGAAIFNHYDHWNVYFNCVLLDGDVGIKICREVAHYIFKVMGCHRCTAVTPRDNIKAQTALTKLGFVWEGVLRHSFPGEVDGFVFGLLRHEQKLLRKL